MANFVSNDNATSLMNAINQKKDSKPATITWAEWIALTDEQREGTHYIITNVPAKFSDKDAVFSIKDETLEFTNKTATVADSRITSDTYIFTFYHNQAVAQAAGIECSWTTGTVTFTVDENPSEDIVVDILCILPALATPETGGSGHTIIDSSGSSLVQENGLQFADSFVSDDDVNGKTIVENIKEHTTKADYDNATEDGFHVIDDGNDVPIGEIEEDVVSVTADGVKTYSQVLDELFALIDVDKLTANAYLEIGEYFIPVVYKSSNLIRAIGCMLADTGNTFINGYYITASGSGLYSWTLKTTGNTVVNNSSTVAPVGTKITLYYGSSSGIVELNTDARHCMMSDGVTSVEGAISGDTILDLFTPSNGTFDWQFARKIGDHLIAYSFRFNATSSIPSGGALATSRIPTICNCVGSANNAGMVVDVVGTNVRNISTSAIGSGSVIIVSGIMIV